MAEREVIYRLKSVYDPSSGASFQSLLSAHTSAMAAMEKRWEAFDALVSGGLDDLLKKHKSGSDGAAKGDEESYSRRKKAAQSYYDYAKAEEEKRFADSMRMRDADNAAQQRSHDERQKMYEKLFADQAAEEQKSVDAAKRAMDERQREHERATAKMKQGDNQLREGLFGVLEGVNRVARGFALLGLASEKDLQKIVSTFAPILGGFEIVLGGVKAWSSVTKAVEGYRTAVQAAAAAEAARSAIGAASGAAGAAGSAAGAAGTAAAGAGGLAAGGGGLAAGMTAAAPFAAAAAALAGIAMAGWAVVETFQGIRENGLGGGTTHGGFSDRVGGLYNQAHVGIYRALKYVGLASGEDNPELERQVKGQDALTKAEKNNAIRRRMDAGYERAAADVTGKRGVDLSLFNLESERYRQQLGFAPKGGDEGSFFGRAGDRYGSAMYRVGSEALGSAAAARRAIDPLAPDKEEQSANRLADYDKALAANRELLELTKMRADEESRIRQSSIGYHNEAIAAAQKELGLLQQMNQSAEDRLFAAKEKFGGMDPAEQARTLMLGKMVKQANELREAGKTDEARAIEGRFTRSDLGAIGGIGLEGTENFTGRVLRERADKAGYGDIFGTEERRRATEAAPKIEKLIADTTVNVEARFKLELDEDQARRALDFAMRPLLERIQELAREQATLKGQVEENKRAAGAKANDQASAIAVALRGVIT